MNLIVVGAMNALMLIEWNITQLTFWIRIEERKNDVCGAGRYGTMYPIGSTRASASSCPQ
jgi:hypothetical protein